MTNGKIVKIRAAAAVCLLLFLVGCLPTATYYRGYEVPVDAVAELRLNEAGSGTMQTFDMSVSYEYRTENGMLEFKGQAVLGEHYQAMYTHIDSLSVYLHFVDDNWRVIETVALLDVFSMPPKRRFNFSKRLVVPSGVRGVSFGYQGSVYESDGDPFFNNGIQFSRLPSRRH